MLGVVKCSNHIEARLLHSMFPGSMNSEAEFLSQIGAQETQVYDQKMCRHMASSISADRNTKHSHKQQQPPLVFLSGWTGQKSVDMIYRTNCSDQQMSNFCPLPISPGLPSQSTLIPLLSFVSSLKSIVSTADSRLPSAPFFL